MIYVGSPYTGNEHTNYHLVLQYTAKLIAKKIVAYSPIVHNHHINIVLGSKPDWETWKNHDLAMLARADALHILQLPGWEKSVGLAAESKFAAANDIPMELIEHMSY